MLQTIEVVGAATGREIASAALVADLAARIERLRERVSGATRPRVFCMEWTDPLWVAGHWVPEMVALAGGEDVLGEPGTPSIRIGWEAVVAAAPEVVVLMPCGYDLVRTLAERPVVEARPGWEVLPAVQAGRIYAVNGSSYFNRPGPRLVDGLELLAHLLHPTLVPAPTLPAAAAALSMPS